MVVVFLLWFFALVLCCGFALSTRKSAFSSFLRVCLFCYRHVDQASPLSCVSLISCADTQSGHFFFPTCLYFSTSTRKSAFSSSLRVCLFQYRHVNQPSLLSYVSLISCADTQSGHFFFPTCLYFSTSTRRSAFSSFLRVCLFCYRHVNQPSLLSCVSFC